MTVRRIALLLVAACVVAGATSAPAAPPAALEPLTFLLGTWEAAGSGAPGAASGSARFEPALGERVILRHSFAEYPASGERPASRHDDLLVIYAAGGGALRADYYDNEGHVIRYAVSTPSAGRAVFVSDAATGAPRFRLSYALEADGTLKGTFEVAPPGKPEAFGPYLAWTSRRTPAAAK